MKNETSMFITMALSAWNSYNDRVTRLVDELTEQQLMAETAPGRNRGIYLFGHLIAVSDRLLPLLGFGERLYPQLDRIFLDVPDRTVAELPSLTELKAQWKKVNEKLSAAFNATSESGWFEKHASVSAEDFAKEPHRNKLNVILNRTGHTSYHLGQLAYLKGK